MTESKMFDPPPPGKIVNRKWKNGKLVSEEFSEDTFKPNAADLDLVLIGCECGNQFDVPYDCVGMMNHENGSCGQCGESGKFSVISDPSPNKKEVGT